MISPVWFQSLTSCSKQSSANICCKAFSFQRKGLFMSAKDKPSRIKKIYGNKVVQLYSVKYIITGTICLISLESVVNTQKPFNTSTLFSFVRHNANETEYD